MSDHTIERASFSDSETRHDEMHRTITTWVEDLVEGVETAVGSEEFQEWLDVQSRFHDYSHRNTLLIKHQYPDATHVAGYRTWQEEFNRHVKAGESAIWIWAPIISKRCPECENSPTYHEQGECQYDETPPEEWDRGLVGFKPTPVFDISQTEGDPLPDLDTAAHGDGSSLVDSLLAVAPELSLEAQIVPAHSWSHGRADGICTQDSTDTHQRIEVKERANQADVAVTLVHEYAHALLHVGQDDTTERAKREVEAEAVAYVVGRYFGLDTSGSAFYLAAWAGDDTDTILERLNRISRTAERLIDTIEGSDV